MIGKYSVMIFSSRAPQASACSSSGIVAMLSISSLISGSSNKAVL
mgnify:CR=1 FL=1